MTSSALLICLAVVPADTGEIDRLLEGAWAKHDLAAAPRCSDETFLRRVTLDLAGRIPTEEEIRAFRAQPDREACIDRLLEGEEFPQFWSEVWTAALLGYTNEFPGDREVLRAWFEDAIRRDTPFDEVARNLITARGTSAFDGPTNFLVRHREDPAVKVCRMFLGVRLDCARCHDHPTDRWTQEDFGRMQRFFEAMEPREVSEGNVRLEDRVVEVDEEEAPRFLTGAQPRTSQWRDELALYLTRSKPFARNYANRMWYHFFGKGIVDPPDDVQAENPPAVPELLEYLAECARAEQFAWRPMIRRICLSRAYQLESVSARDDAVRQRYFAARMVKPLTPEQLIDSIGVALQRSFSVPERREQVRRLTGEAPEDDFSMTWEYRETVQQLLQNLNVSPELETVGVPVLYHRFLGREPTTEEFELCRGRSTRQIAFALLHSNEFRFNH